MVRTHPSSEYRYPEYDRLNRRQKDELQRVPNRERETRLQIIETKPLKIHSERGIELNKLPRGSIVPDIIRRRGWEGLAEHPAGYDPSVVNDFYANMHPPTFLNRKTVMMGRIRVQITPEIICDYFGIPSQPELHRTFGLSNHPHFQTSYNGEIASSLRRNASTRWDSQRNRLMKSDLHYDMGFLMLFVKANLKPSTFCTAADELVAEVLYSLQHNLPLDIGIIIWLEIMDTGHSLSRTLPFPCLITELCRRAGVPVAARLTKPMGPFSSRHFSFQRSSGKKREDRRHQGDAPGEPEFSSGSEPEHEDPDFDPENPEHEEVPPQSEPVYQQQPFNQGFQQQGFQEPGYQQFAFQQLPPYQQPQVPFYDDAPQYLTEMFQSIHLGLAGTNERLDIVNNNMQFVHNNVQHLNSHVQYLSQRMDWEGFPRTDQEAMGEQRRRRRRRHDGASGSGSGHGHQEE